MRKIKIYRFDSYDVVNDQIKTSKRWGTREAIRDIAHGRVIEESEIEVDESVVASDIHGLTAVGFKPEREQGGKMK